MHQILLYDTYEGCRCLPDARKLLQVEVAEHGPEHGERALREGGEGRQVHLRDVERRRVLGGAVLVAARCLKVAARVEGRG